MPHEFELRKEIELEATPEQVWEAIATGPGLDSWFMGRNEVDPGAGGRTRLTIAGQAQESTVTGWEPGRLFAHRMAPGSDGAFMAFEYLIEGRDQGSTVLRLVQSGVLGGDWEAEYEAMQAGWDMYLRTLVAYLRHFPGRTAAPVFAARPGAGGPDRMWPALTAALGLAGAVTEGTPVRFTVPDLAPITGVVDLAGLPTFLGVRSDDAFYRFIHSGSKRGDVLVLGHHLFDADVSQQEAERAWQSWVAALPLGLSARSDAG